MTALMRPLAWQLELDADNALLLWREVERLDTICGWLQRQPGMEVPDDTDQFAGLFGGRPIGAYAAAIAERHAARAEHAAAIERLQVNAGGIEEAAAHLRAAEIRATEKALSELRDRP
jgi:hypothetical protein